MSLDLKFMLPMLNWVCSQNFKDFGIYLRSYLRGQKESYLKKAESLSSTFQNILGEYSFEQSATCNSNSDRSSWVRAIESSWEYTFILDHMLFSRYT